MKLFSIKKLHPHVFALSIAIFFCLSNATEKNVELLGYSSYSFGQIVNGTYDFDQGSTNIDHYWQQEVYTGIGFRALLNEKFIIKANIEGKSWYPYPNVTVGQPAYKRLSYALWLDQGNAEYKLGDPEKPWVTFTMGYFKYKYNHEARNLGEQLFRSIAYPGIIINYFDFPAIRLLGYQAHFELLEGKLKADALLISETDCYPFGDFSPAVIASYKPHNVIEIGGGVELARFFQ